MFPNDQLAIYRTQANLAIWGGLIQADGSCVALSAQHVPYWSTGAAGHTDRDARLPGSSVPDLHVEPLS